MNSTAGAILAATGAFAVVDWFAVARGVRRLEYVCKPAVMVGLTAVALTVDADIEAQRWWFVGALVASLAGDVFLMLRHAQSAERERRLFVAGLAAFLVAHLGYAAGFVAGDLPGRRLLVAAALVVLVAVPAGRGIVSGAIRHGRGLAGAVVAYMAVISAMVTAAGASGDATASVGAAGFFISDFLIGWTRFVRVVPAGPVLIMVTYHLGQTALVVSLG